MSTFESFKMALDFQRSPSIFRPPKTALQRGGAAGIMCRFLIVPAQQTARLPDCLCIKNGGFPSFGAVRLYTFYVGPEIHGTWREAEFTWRGYNHACALKEKVVELPPIG